MSAAGPARSYAGDLLLRRRWRQRCSHFPGACCLRMSKSASLTRPPRCMCCAVAAEKAGPPLRSQLALAALQCRLLPAPAEWVTGNGSARLLDIRQALHPPAVPWLRQPRPCVSVDRSLAKLRGFFPMVTQSDHYVVKWNPEKPGWHLLQLQRHLASQTSRSSAKMLHLRACGPHRPGH